MDFYAVLDQAVDLLRQRGRVTYRALKLQFQLDDDQLEALKDELLYAHLGMATPAAVHVIGQLSARDWGSVQACLTRTLAIPEPPSS